MSMPDINNRLEQPTYKKIRIFNEGGDVILAVDPLNNPLVPLSKPIGQPIRFFEISDNTFVETYVLGYRRKDVNGMVLPISFNGIPKDQVDILKNITKYAIIYLEVGYGSDPISYRGYINNISYQSIQRSDYYNVNMSIILLEET